MNSEQGKFAITRGLGLIYCGICHICVQPVNEEETDIRRICIEHNKSMGHIRGAIIGRRAIFLPHSRVLRELTSEYQSIPLGSAEMVMSDEFVKWGAKR
jgi:hypothetical protein